MFDAFEQAIIHNLVTDIAEIRLAIFDVAPGDANRLGQKLMTKLSVLLRMPAVTRENIWPKLKGTLKDTLKHGYQSNIVTPELPEQCTPNVVRKCLAHVIVDFLTNILNIKTEPKMLQWIETLRDNPSSLMS